MTPACRGRPATVVGGGARDPRPETTDPEETT